MCGRVRHFKQLQHPEKSLLRGSKCREIGKREGSLTLQWDGGGGDVRAGGAQASRVPANLGGVPGVWTAMQGCAPAVAKHTLGRVRAKPARANQVHQGLGLPCRV